MNNIYLTADGVYNKVYLSEEEKTLLSIINYLTDKDHGIGNTEHFDNIMMCSQVSNTVENLLTKVDNKLDSTYYKLKVG